MVIISAPDLAPDGAETRAGRRGQGQGSSEGCGAAEGREEAPTPGAHATRLKRIVDEINRCHDVEGLCRGFVTRIDKLVDKKGGRLSE